MVRNRRPWPRLPIRPWSVLLLAAAIAACDTAASPSATPHASPSAAACAPAALAAGGISGRVLNEQGEPLSDVLVVLETADFYGTVRTGEDGVFTAPGVTGSFRISTTDAEYAAPPRDVVVACGELVDVEMVLSPTGG